LAALYDRIGRSYALSREPDPRIAARVRRALGDARTVLNVGAGAGAYEPPDLDVLAVEPSAVMIAQRPPGSAPVLEACAERIPLPDDSVDAAMTILSDHHWTDRAAGLRELRRVARRRVVLLNADPAVVCAFWLSREYLPSFANLIPERWRHAGAWERELEEHLGPIVTEVVPVPRDCRDGFYAAYWRRPEAYLSPEIRDNISVFRLLPEADVRDAVDRLAADLADGSWYERHHELTTLDELDVGMRIAVAQVTPS
jgi:SAM-dependent methyltransferase